MKIRIYAAPVVKGLKIFQRFDKSVLTSRCSIYYVSVSQRCTSTSAGRAHPMYVHEH